MFNHSITQGYADDAGSVKSVNTKFTGQTADGFDGVVNAGATDFEIDVEWKNSAVQSLCLWSDQAVSIKTNSTTAPGQTINLVANQMVQFGQGMGLTNPFTVHVTKLYVTNAGTTNANFKVRVLSA
jgi:hypothetical protein